MLRITVPYLQQSSLIILTFTSKKKNAGQNSSRPRAIEGGYPLQHTTTQVTNSIASSSLRKISCVSPTTRRASRKLLNVDLLIEQLVRMESQVQLACLLSRFMPCLFLRRNYSPQIVVVPKKSRTRFHNSRTTLTTFTIYSSSTAATILFYHVKHQPVARIKAQRLKLQKRRTTKLERGDHDPCCAG